MSGFLFLQAILCINGSELDSQPESQGWQLERVGNPSCLELFIEYRFHWVGKGLLDITQCDAGKRGQLEADFPARLLVFCQAARPRLREDF